MHLMSDRLYIRPYNDDDFNFLMSMLSDREMVQFIGEGETKDKGGVKEFLNWIYHTYKVDNDLGLKVLIRREDNTPVGHAGLVPQNSENNM
jgi:RimJ/RimL family protein N-acetyltransferase